MSALRWILLSVVFLVAWHPSAPAQQPAVGSVRGEVYDSLIGARLEGASVAVRGTGLQATTDRQGRFRLDSVPVGRQVLVLEHPSLDSAGLSGLPWAVEVAGGQTAQAVLAIPSLGTFAARACTGASALVGGDSGVVFGTVRDAERGVRLAGAQVFASWVAVDRSRRQPRATRQARDAVADSVGNYRICGVPGGVGISLVAVAGNHPSGDLALEVGARRVLRHDLSVSRESPAAEADTAAGTRRGLATVIGTVHGARGDPVQDARAGVVGASAEAVSDRSGRFVLTGLPSGSQMLLVRRVGFGYSATPVALRNRDTTRVSISLHSVTILDTIQVTTTEWVRTEIEELRSRLRSGAGNRIRTAEELAAMGTIHGAIQEFPGLSVQTAAQRARGGGPGIQMRRGNAVCSPDVYIDGWKADMEQLEFYRPADLLALEVYPAGQTPMRYMKPFGNCGVVLAWTRYLR